MSALKERAKQLIDQLPDEVVSQLLEDLEDALDLEDLEKAIAAEGHQPGIPLHEFSLEQLRPRGEALFMSYALTIKHRSKAY
jgi:hypothetical protein